MSMGAEGRYSKRNIHAQLLFIGVVETSPITWATANGDTKSVFH